MYPFHGGMGFSDGNLYDLMAVLASNHAYETSACFISCFLQSAERAVVSLAELAAAAPALKPMFLSFLNRTMGFLEQIMGFVK